MTQETNDVVGRIVPPPIPNPRATPGARRAPIDEALAFLRANRDTHTKWAEYFEQNPAVEADYLKTGVWEGAADQRRVERQYSAAILTFEKAADELQSQSARIAETDELLASAYKRGWREGCESVLDANGIDGPIAYPHNDVMGEGCGNFLAEYYLSLTKDTTSG